MKEGIVAFIRETIEEKGYTYEQIAEKMGTSRQNVWNILYGRDGNKLTGEKGRRDPDFSTVVKLLDALGMELTVVKGSAPNPEKMIEAAASERVPFSAASAIMEAAGYYLEATQKNE